MNEKTKRIGFACALGAFIGALLSLKIADWFAVDKYLWPVGALVGGGIGYLAYDLKAIGVAIKHVYNQIFGRNRQSQVLRFRLWLDLQAFLGLSTMFFIIGLWSSLGLVSLCMKGLSMNMRWCEAFTFIGIFATFLLVVFTPLSMSLALVIGHSNRKRRENSVKIFFLFLKYSNPIMMPYFTLRLLFKRKSWQWLMVKTAIGAQRTWLSMKIVERFIKLVFIQIHSSERVLCLCDAFIGATIGYFFGSPIIGAIFGAVFGILNYEIMSVRLLKLIPRRE